jgi:hypothetical protein
MRDVTLRTSTAKSFQFLSQKAPLKALKAAAKSATEANREGGGEREYELSALPAV